jgi:hypothetical protein
MQIIVTELPIEDAVGRARSRFGQADERLAQAPPLAARSRGLPWIALGALVSGAGTLWC